MMHLSRCCYFRTICGPTPARSRRSVLWGNRGRAAAADVLRWCTTRPVVVASVSKCQALTVAAQHWLWCVCCVVCGGIGRGGIERMECAPLLKNMGGATTRVLVLPLPRTPSTRANVAAAASKRLYFCAADGAGSCGRRGGAVGL